MDNKQFCKLCLERNDELIGILSDEGVRLNIDSTLSQHFYFKFEAGNSNNICRKCWWQVETFHAFYLRIEDIHSIHGKGEQIFVASLDGKVQYDLRSTGKKSGSAKTTARGERRSRRRTRANNMDGAIPYVIETDGGNAQDDSYWEDVNSIMNSNIDTAIFPKEELIEEQIEAPIVQATPLEVSAEDDDDMPLIIYKEKTVKKGGEITTKATELEGCDKSDIDDDWPDDFPASDKESDDMDQAKSSTAKESEDIPLNSKKTSRKTRKTASKDKSPKSRKKRIRIRHRTMRNTDITPEQSATLKAQLIADQKFQCEKVDYSQIKKHMELICNLCQEPFTTFQESQNHFLEFHERPAFWKCCRIQLDTEYQVVDHMKYHADSDAFKCIVCEKQFLTTNKLQNHIRRFHLIADSEFECSICFKKFPSQRHFVLHEKRHITLQCPHCDKIITAANYDRHIKFAHTTTVKVMCDICGKVSCDRKAHNLHYLVEHSGIDQKLQCDMCGQWAKHRKQLSKHMRKHFDTPQTCKICGKVTPNKYALSSHKTIHKEGKHKCRFCGKIYIKRKMLEEHESIHTGIKDLYHCDFCDKTFRFNSGMYAHRKKAHPVEYEEKIKNQLPK